MFAIKLVPRSQGMFRRSVVLFGARHSDSGFVSRAKDAVAAMIKRLAHRNANVQLYTLEVRAGSGGMPEFCGLTCTDMAIVGERPRSELRSQDSS